MIRLSSIVLGATLATGLFGQAVHEIGHAVGLWHEQSREDRDSFVQIHWANVQAGKEHNFNQHITDGDDVNAYDYGSIMHYPRDAFSSNGQDTITPTNPANAQIGQRNGLSAGDIAAVASMYGGTGGVVTIKKFQDDHGGIKKVLDDQVGVKKISDDTPPPKKVFDDTNRFKKVRDDVRPPIKKIVDDGVVGPQRPPFPIPGPGPLIPGLSPFLLATQHHADVGATGDEQAAVAQAALAAVQLAADAVEDAERNVVALQTALTSATSALAKAQQGYAAAVQMLGQM